MEASVWSLLWKMNQMTTLACSLISSTDLTMVIWSQISWTK